LTAGFRPTPRQTDLPAAMRSLAGISVTLPKIAEF
jgi:hypothetical protein